MNSKERLEVLDLYKHISGVLCCVIMYHCNQSFQLILLTIDHSCMSLCSCHFRNGHLEVVKFLLINTTVTADVNAKSNSNRTPLHYACE